MFLRLKLKRPRSMKKYIVLLCTVAIVFFVAQNKQFRVNDYAASEARTEANKWIPLKLNADVQSKIETLALFIGYPRSGQTLISALLDAHPHIIIANEFGIFERWREWRRDEKTRENLINKMYESSVREARGFEFRSREKKRGQIYDVPDQWQGDFMNYIKVIGDKKVKQASKYLSGKEWQQLRKEVLDEINLPLRLIHIVRNPFDNIATMTFRSLEMSTDEAKASEKKINATSALDDSVRVYLWEANNNYELIQRYGSKALTIHSEDVIDNPRTLLKKLCEFLEVACTDYYIHDCASIVYDSPSKTRSTIVWPDVYKQKVEKAIKDIPFLRRYNFDS